MALENIVSEVDLDVYDHDQIVPGIKAISGDSVVRYVKANILRSGESYIIDDENVTVKLHALRPDHTLVIGPATYEMETVMISPEYTPVREVVTEEPFERYYYYNENEDKIYVDGPEDVPEGYEVETEMAGGSSSIHWYYVDENGNVIYVNSGNVIPAVYAVSYELYAELSKEMLAVPGTVRGQFKIEVGDQVLKTSMFNVVVGEDLSRNYADTIDLTMQ